MRPPKITAVTVTPPAYKASGGVAAALHLTRSLSRVGDASMLLMADRDETSIEDGLRIVRRKAKNLWGPALPLMPRVLSTLAWRMDLEDVLKAEAPALVHLHNPHPPGAFLGAARACRALGLPYVISTHGFVEFHDLARGFGRPAWERPVIDAMIRLPVEDVIRGAAAICMLSPLEAPILRDMGARDEQLRVVTNGIDPFYLETLPEAERLALVARFAIPADRPMAFFVGNHTANKGIDVLLDSLHRTQTNFTTVIAGAIRSREEHEALRRRHDTDALADRLIFTDFTSREELRALYQSASLFAFPTRADTLPLVVLEAMASRLPVLSTTVGGIPYQVSPDSGVLVAPGDPAAVAAALDGLVSDPARRAAMGLAGRRAVEERFLWEAAAKSAMCVYEEVLAR